MKRIFILLSFACIAPGLIAAQEEMAEAAAAAANPNQAQQFSISVDGGMTFAFTDVNESKSAPVFGIGAPNMRPNPGSPSMSRYRPVPSNQETAAKPLCPIWSSRIIFSTAHLPAAFIRCGLS